jgi:hypothetical protein
MTMITRISTGSSSTVAQLLGTVCCTSSSTRSGGYRGVGRPSAVAPHRAGHPEPDQPHDLHRVAILLRLRAGTVACRSAATQRRVGRHDAGQDIDSLDTVSRLSRSTSRVPDREGEAPHDVPFPGRGGRFGSTPERRSSLSSACSVALKRDGEPDTSPGDELTPLFGARCLSTGLLHFGRRHREVITAGWSLTRYHPPCHCAGIAGRGRPFLRWRGAWRQRPPSPARPAVAAPKVGSISRRARPARDGNQAADRPRSEHQAVPAEHLLVAARPPVGTSPQVQVDIR